jgi:tRNA pseudouridine38-40 synthase
MIRIITGTLVDVGLEKIEPEQIIKIIESKNRENAGKTMPPQGLFLVEVNYE